MVQVPTSLIVTLLALTVHTAAVSETKVTARPDDALALMVNGATP